MATLRIRNGRVTVDPLARGEEITLAAWRDGVRPEAGRFDLSIPNTENVEELGGAIQGFDAVVLEFPNFKDGRAYSQARILRERLKFKGEIRARGAVFCDQALFLARAGFDALDIGGGDADAFKAALGAYSVFYQPAADDAAPARALRAANRRAA